MKKLLFSLTAIATFNVLIAQTINSTDINPVVGDEFVYHNTDYISPGDAGLNQTWDLSSMTSTNQETVSYTASGHPDANITQTYSNGQVVEWDYSSSGQHIIVQTAQGVSVEYSNPWTYIGLPLTMGTTGSDTFNSSFNSGGTNFERSGETNWEVDGIGTLITPAGTFTDVIRVKIIDEYMDESNFSTIIYYGESYLYLKAGHHHQLASLATIETNFSAPASFGTYLDESSLSLEENELSFKIYPNPTSDFLNVSISNQAKIGKIEVHDLNGRLVIESIDSHIDVSKINNGVYTVVILGKDNAVLTRQKFIKK